MRPFNILAQRLIKHQFFKLQSRSISAGAPRSKLDEKNDQFNETNHGGSKRILYYGALIGVGVVASTTAYKRLQALSKDDLGKSSIKDPHSNDKSRLFSRSEVAKHDNLDKGVWITYKGNVYDITDFIRHHPGGSHTIMMGAGGDVEPFWQTYTVHHASEVQNLLATYKIGTLSPDDKQPNKTEEQNSDSSPFANDPKRSPLLKVLTEQPFNAETPAKLLTTSYLTPNETFFVRNHLPVPEVDLDDYKLAICFGSDGDPDNLKVVAEFTLEDLKKKFKPHSVDSIIQCSGNRRSDLKRFKEIKGLDWKVGAISNARWTGVRLVDLMDSLGIKPDPKSIKHVQMEGLDCDMTGQSYGASISSDYAFDPEKDVILAYEMNGEPLTRDHGFPLRFVAPGVTGARNVKWLSKIIFSNEESHSHWQRKDYKSFSPNVTMFDVNFDQSASVQETPVQSAICYPSDDREYVINFSEESNGETKKYFVPTGGYAYSGGGKMIVRVDVSVDGGANWMTANLLDNPKNPDGTPDYTNRNRVYSWTRWTLDVPVPNDLIKQGSGSLEILCRAFDSSYNSQPERPETIWNVRGVLNNSWHKIKLDVKMKKNDN